MSGVQRPPGYAAHHIVAGNDQRAAAAREILKQFGISINAAVNGVFLPADKEAEIINGEAVHSSLHTRDYFDAVEDALKMAKAREEAADVLRRIGRALQSGNFP